MTVAQWYQVYSRPEYRDTYIVLPKQTQRKGKTGLKPYAFSVELYINVGQVSACFSVLLNQFDAELGSIPLELPIPSLSALERLERNARPLPLVLWYYIVVVRALSVLAVGQTSALKHIRLLTTRRQRLHHSQQDKPSDRFSLEMATSSRRLHLLSVL